MRSHRMRSTKVPSATKKHVATCPSINRKHRPPVPTDTIGMSGTARGLLGKCRSHVAHHVPPACTLQFRAKQEFVFYNKMTRDVPFYSAYPSPWVIAHVVQRHSFGLCHFWTILLRDRNVTCVTVSTLLTFARFTVATLTEREAWA